jgi:hypothetical protein
MATPETRRSAAAGGRRHLRGRRRGRDRCGRLRWTREGLRSFRARRLRAERFRAGCLRRRRDRANGRCLVAVTYSRGRSQLHRGSAAQADRDRSAGRRDHNARRRFASRSASPAAFPAGCTSDREAGDEQCAHQCHNDEPAKVHSCPFSAGADQASLDANHVHDVGHAIGLIPV